MDILEMVAKTGLLFVAIVVTAVGLFLSFVRALQDELLSEIATGAVTIAVLFASLWFLTRI